MDSSVPCSRRSVDWKDAAADARERGAVFRSRGPLLDPADCAWVIREVTRAGARQLSAW